MAAHVQSYLVVPSAGCRARVAARLASMPGCTVIPALNHELLIVVAETESEGARQVLEVALHALPDVRGVMFVGGWMDGAEHGSAPAEP